MSSRTSRTLHIRMASLLAVAFTATPLLGQVEQVAILRPDTEPAPGAYYGGPVRINGDYVVVGAFGANVGGVGAAGAAFVFKRNGSEWTQHAILTASDGGLKDGFGFSLAIDGDRIAIGAPTPDSAWGHPGKAYIFRLEGNTWVEEAILIPSTSTLDDEFGWSISLDGDRVVVGARQYAFTDQTGAAYVFRREGASWIEEAEIRASDAEVGDAFGNSVSLEGDLLVVGAWAADDACPSDVSCDSGSVYAFRREGTSWIQEAKLVPTDTRRRDAFGRLVSLSSDYVVVGSIRNDAGAIDSGAAYVFFRRNVGDWREQAKLVHSDAAEEDHLGVAVVDGNLVIGGAPGRDEACPPEDPFCSSGAVYLFIRIGSTWLQQTKFVPSNDTVFFGRSISLDGETAVIGGGGGPYVFRVEREPDRIPAVSSWGLLILALVLLVVAKIVFRRTRASRTHGLI